MRLLLLIVLSVAVTACDKRVHEASLPARPDPLAGIGQH